MVQNPPAHAADVGSIPGLGRFRRPWGAITAEPVSLAPMLCNKRIHRSENSMHHSWEAAPQ